VCGLCVGCVVVEYGSLLSCLRSQNDGECSLKKRLYDRTKSI